MKQNRPRLTDRAYSLAERLDPSGNRSIAIEKALELCAALHGFQSGTPFPYGRGEHSADAVNVLLGIFSDERDRIYRRATERAVDAATLRTVEILRPVLPESVIEALDRVEDEEES